MNKKTIQLIALLGVLVLLVAGYFVIRSLISGEQTDTPSTDGEGTTALQTYDICNVDQNSVHTIAYTLDGNEYRYTLNDDRTAWLWSENPALPLDNAFFANMVTAFTNLTSTVCLTEVEESAALNDYGLQPTFTIHFEDAVYGAQTFRIGAYNSYNGMYYLCRDNDLSTVYMVSADVPLQFLYTAQDMLAKPAVPTNITRSKLTSLTLTSPDGAHTLVCTYYVGGKVEGEEDVWYVSLDGGAQTRLSESDGDALSTALSTLAFSEIVDFTEDKKADYGLSAPTRMVIDYKVTTKFEDEATGEITSVDTNEQFTLLLGNISDSGLCYATIEDSPLSCTLMGNIFASLLRMLQPTP